MNENGGFTRTRSEQGSIGLGLLQTLGVYVLGLAAYLVLATSGFSGDLITALELIGALSVGLNLMLGVRHGRRGRQRTATGYLIGILLWPAITFALLAWAVSNAMSHANIPF